MPAFTRARSRSASPSDSDDNDGGYEEYRYVDRALRGKDGLHADQNPTPSRLRNPGKYTDKSMRRTHSKRSQGRERSPAFPSVMRENQNVGGTCVNNYGAIKSCNELVTRVNYRPTYVVRDRLPLQMMYAMLLDEHPDVVRTYDRGRVLSYLAGVVARALSGLDEHEPDGWNNLLIFAEHAVNILAQEHVMVGDVDPITVLAERYLVPRFTGQYGYRLIVDSIHQVGNTTVINTLRNLKTLVDNTNPQVRLWSFDDNIDKTHGTVLLRRGQVRSHPWEELKATLDRSIEVFGSGRGRPVHAAGSGAVRGSGRGGGRRGGRPRDGRRGGPSAHVSDRAGHGSGPPQSPRANDRTRSINTRVRGRSRDQTPATSRGLRSPTPDRVRNGDRGRPPQPVRRDRSVSPGPPPTPGRNLPSTPPDSGRRDRGRRRSRRRSPSVQSRSSSVASLGPPPRTPGWDIPIGRAGSRSPAPTTHLDLARSADNFGTDF